MINLVSLKCPECHAALAIEEGRKYCFCQYCGTKILIDDGSTSHTYRKIDEARIKEAEVKERIRLKELLLEEKKQAAKERRNKVKIIISVILGIIGLLFLTIGLSGGAATESIGIIGMAALSILIYIWLLGSYQKNN